MVEKENELSGSITREKFIQPLPLTLTQLKQAIPAHCFERSYITSFSYLFGDLLGVYILGYIATTYIPEIPSSLWHFKAVAWLAYWYVQGAVMTGLWVLAHECGHQAFSPSQLVNDTVGCIVHSALLVPYFSWKFSHARHHRNCGSVENDEAFVPRTREETLDIFPDTALPILLLIIGWPIHLFFNATGPMKYQKLPKSHFNPYAVIFTEKERFWIVVSDVALLAVLAVSAWSIHKFGFLSYFNLYFIPYLIVNCWLVCITCLHHTHKDVPHYRSKEWTWLRGALCTVDRDYGWFLNTLHHHISDTHICHHLFSYLPHYHAEEATVHLKKVLGDLYNHDQTPIWKAFFSTVVNCKTIPSTGETVFYSS